MSEANNIFEYDSVKNIIRPIVESLVKKSKGEKAIESIFDSIIIALLKSNFNVSGIKKYVEDYLNDNIIEDKNLLWKEANLFDSIKSEYRDLGKALFTQRPYGIGTPNAAAGDGELLLLAFSNSINTSKTANSGDLEIKNKKVELKGNGVRIFGNISGKELNKKMHEIGIKYKLNPNDRGSKKKPTKPAYEPWQTTKIARPHWINEFKKINLKDAINFLHETTRAMKINISKEEIASCFSDGEYDVDKFIILITKGFWESSNHKWDYFSCIDNEYNVRYIENNSDKFFEMLNSGKIFVSGNYMRINQDLKIGYYIEFK